MFKLSMFLLLLSMSQFSYAERLMPMEFIGQPLMLLDGGNPQSCGIRVVGIQPPLDINNPNEVLLAPDGSFMLDRKGYGLVKALAYKTTVKDVSSQKAPEDMPFKGFWFKAANVKATTPLLKTIQGEQKHSLIYATDADSIVGLYGAVLENQPIQFALKFENGAEDVAFYGKVIIREDEIQQVMSCMSELSNLVNKDIESETKKK